jgi:hypothetical protein
VTHLTNLEVITAVLPMIQFFWDVMPMELKAPLFFEADPSVRAV